MEFGLPFKCLLFVCHGRLTFGGFKIAQIGLSSWPPPFSHFAHLLQRAILLLSLGQYFAIFPLKPFLFRVIPIISFLFPLKFFTPSPQQFFHSFQPFSAKSQSKKCPKPFSSNSNGPLSAQCPPIIHFFNHIFGPILTNLNAQILNWPIETQKGDEAFTPKDESIKKWQR